MNNNLFRKTPFDRNDQRNVVANPLFKGVRPGVVSPGWYAFDNGSGATLGFSSGIDGGIPYQDFRISGTLAAGYPFFGEDMSLPASLHSGVIGNVWNCSVWVEIRPGSTSGLPTELFTSFDEYDSVGGYAGTVFSPSLAVPAVGRKVKFSDNLTQLQATAQYIGAGFLVANCPGGATDFTMRIWLPSMVKVG